MGCYTLNISETVVMQGNVTFKKNCLLLYDLNVLVKVS